MIQFKQSPVCFDEDSHTYHLGDKRLLGITGLIHSILGLGVYPDASEHVKDFIIPRAGSRGTAVHHAIQMYDQLGIKQATQIVHTCYGCEERDNLHLVNEEWDVSAELEAYMENPDSDAPLSQVGLTPAAKIELTLLPNIRMTPVDEMSAWDFIRIFEFRFGRRGYNSKKHEHKVKKHSPMLRIGDEHQKYQLCF